MRNAGRGASRDSLLATVRCHPSTETPYYEVIQNDTCVLTPVVTPGAYYWPRSQLLRQDMIETQTGVPLWDVGVLDMATCAPLAGAMVDLWQCNATGSYSSFTGNSPNTLLSDTLSREGKSQTDFKVGATDIHTDSETWLRGMWPTDEHGLMQMKTIFPGFYIQGAIHIHVQVHTNWTLGSNGTLATKRTVSTGPLYFDEDIEQRVMAIEPYTSHTEIQRVRNSDDSNFPNASQNGYNPITSGILLEPGDISKGLIGYITLGIDTTIGDDGFSTLDLVNSPL
ncbi:uncharacterized protein N7459_000350 [Penicillium hispanicum]|uniref:uncharacterized protein n=1 Tax=Penicillium hispanicum TaxID=1080232 RepID=UPI0025402028|nr:uncharacterized protein N7459_000350 [Penicillium hispanicum]KAJ5594142.1 hypothetical protein N7459_000350 [Penicillium hispanicum]